MMNRSEEADLKRTPKVIFLHIPKTAGMSLRGLFVKNYRGAPQFNTDLKDLTFEAWQTCLDMVKQMPSENLEQFRVFKGHMPFGLHKVLPGPVDYITFLREPVKRVISHYRMLHRKNVFPSGLVIDPSKKNWNLDAFPTFFRDLDNLQTRMLSGANLNDPFGTCTEEHLRQAKANLDQFKFVGLTEQFDLSLMLLKRLCGWRWHFYVPDNRSTGDPAPLSPALLEEIRNLNRFDYELYRYAEERLQRLVDEHGWKVKAECRLFQQGNYLHQALHVWKHRSKRSLGIERREAMMVELPGKDSTNS
jgi:hypothetical protein